MSYNPQQAPNWEYGSPPHSVPAPTPPGQAQPPYSIPPQEPYSQPQVPYGYGIPAQGPYGTLDYQQPGDGYTIPAGQAAPLPLGTALRQLPRQYIKALTKPSATTFAEEQSKASWGNVWIQLMGYALVAAVLGWLGNVISHTASSGLLITIFAAVIVVPIAFFLIGGVEYLLARAFGGQGTFLAQMYTMLLYSVPLGILLALLGLVPVLGGVANMVGGIYGILLNVYMIMGVHHLRRGRAVVVVLFPVVIIVVLVVLAILAGMRV